MAWAGFLHRKNAFICMTAKPCWTAWYAPNIKTCGICVGRVFVGRVKFVWKIAPAPPNVKIYPLPSLMTVKCWRAVVCLAVRLWCVMRKSEVYLMNLWKTVKWTPCFGGLLIFCVSLSILSTLQNYHKFPQHQTIYKTVIYWYDWINKWAICLLWSNDCIKFLLL